MIAPSLKERTLAHRAGMAILLETPQGVLSAAQAAQLGPAADLDPAATVLVSIDDPRHLIETLLALDGHVAGLLLVSQGVAPDVTAALAEVAGATLVVTDRDDLPGARAPADILGPPAAARVATAWMMTTSGTTGMPKIVPHTLASLARTVRRDPLAKAPIWGMVYEMTRFAGLQVVLQALIGGGTLAVVPRHAPMQDQVAFLAGAGASHLSATPTLWRRLLMAPGLGALPLRQATMGGEIADQAVLDAVHRLFPQARLTHIYASTEVGVGFAVNDRKAGFPMRFVDEAPGGVGVRIRDGMLWLKPPEARTARYLGGTVLQNDSQGYVNTGDRVDVAGDRAYFLGRDSGVVNVGGVKVYPEHVERTIAAVEGVGLAAVSARKNPITGALLTATVVPTDPATAEAVLRDRILAACRASLEREAVPARISFAASLDVNAAGKIVRQ